MINLDWDSFYKKGCMVFNAPELFVHLEKPLSKTRWIWLPIYEKNINYRTPLNKLAYRKPMRSTSNLIFDKCFSQITSHEEVNYSHVWNGTVLDSCEWHNDYVEGSNVSVLMYYSDVKENMGGELMMRKLSDRIITEVHRPSKYDVVIFSQEKIWQHRVAHFLDYSMERITINFGFTIPELAYGFNN